MMHTARRLAFRIRPRPDDPAPLGRSGHVRIVWLDACRHLADAAVMDEIERMRAMRFRFDRDWIGSMSGRAMPRRILGRSASSRSRSRFRATVLSLTAMRCSSTSRNPGNPALRAITQEGPVQIDVEQMRPVSDLEGVAGLVMSPRERAAFAAPTRPARLLPRHLGAQGAPFLKASRMARCDRRLVPGSARCLVWSANQTAIWRNPTSPNAGGAPRSGRSRDTGLSWLMPPSLDYGAIFDVLE